jgi:GxxExxY protein
MIKNDLTYKIIGYAMKVHRKMGPGLQEVIYQRCLAIGLERARLSFVREQEQPVYYDGIQVGTRRADFIVENHVVVELKAVVKLDDVHLESVTNIPDTQKGEKADNHQFCHRIEIGIKSSKSTSPKFTNPRRNYVYCLE